MNRERLIRLRDELRAEMKKLSKTRHFDMRTWFRVDEPEVGIEQREVVCGTSACALGVACTIPEFRDAGLHLECRRGEYYPKFGEETTYGAAEKFFDITFDQTHFIFDPFYYRDVDGWAITPDMVADRINKVLDGEM